MSLADGINKELADKIKEAEASSSALGKSVENSIAVDPRKVADIAPNNWDKNYRYYFTIVEADDAGGVSNTGANFLEDVYILDLNPQSLVINTPFASSVVATNKGVLEESNGVVFRMISISGTTGILPGRPSQEDPRPNGIFSLKSVIPSGVKAFGALSDAVKSVFGANDIGPKMIAGDENTGYYRFWNLNKFLVSYSESKKRPGNQKRRLLFNCPKDNTSYIVTPVSFDMRRDASQPMLYRYSIVLRGFDIATASPSVLDVNKDIPKGGINSIRDILDRVRKGRRAILESRNVVKAVQSDVNDVLNSINQVAMAFKDARGLIYDVIDFLPILLNNATLLAKNSGKQFGQAALDGASADSDYKEFKKIVDQQKLFPLIQTGGNSQARSDNKSPTGETKDQDVDTSASEVKLVTNILNTPSLIDKMPLSALGALPKSIQDQIDVQKAAAKTISVGAVRDLSNTMQAISDNLAYTTGGIDANYANAFGLPLSKSVNDRPLTEDDVLLAVQIQEAKDALIEMSVTKGLFNNGSPDPFKAANLALQEQDKIPTPLSGFPITMTRDATLEDVAREYLGDSTRARELAVFNSLRAPYIDEDGFKLAIGLCKGKTFIVNDSANLAIGQSILIQGTGIRTIKQRILNIEDLGSKIFRVMIDGSNDLDQYTSSKSPYLTARLPGTVGSGDIILIPTNRSPSDANTDRNTPLYERLSFAERVFKVDLAIDFETNDLAISPTGDIARSYGYQNAAQAIRLLLETEVGELDRHPSYGVPVSIGQRNSDTRITDLTSRISKSITRDRRFSDAHVTAVLVGNVVRVTVEVTGAGGTGLLPLQFEINL